MKIKNDIYLVLIAREKTIEQLIRSRALMKKSRDTYMKLYDEARRCVLSNYPH